MGIHGTIDDGSRQHPVLELKQWIERFPVDERRDSGSWIDSPPDVARFEQARRLAGTNGDLGPSVPVDIFIWADGVLRETPWLTRIGGTPWREKGRKWPKGKDGFPLTFLGQICFIDSKDIVPFDLPGDVLLIFGCHNGREVSSYHGAAIEWSPLQIGDPEDGRTIPRGGELPIKYQGIIHRTVQHTVPETFDPPFIAAGYKHGGWGLASVQASSIGSFAEIPQGWPFSHEGGNQLLCTLSSFYCQGPWPLSDWAGEPKQIAPKGHEVDLWNRAALEFAVGDAGTFWVRRDKRGKFHLHDSCG